MGFKIGNRQIFVKKKYQRREITVIFYTIANELTETNYLIRIYRQQVLLMNNILNPANNYGAAENIRNL